MAVIFRTGDSRLGPTRKNKGIKMRLMTRAILRVPVMLRGRNLSGDIQKVFVFETVFGVDHYIGQWSQFGGLYVEVADTEPFLGIGHKELAVRK